MITAILLGPGPDSGKVIEVDERFKVQPLLRPEQRAVQLSDYQPEQAWPQVVDETYVTRTWRWDGTVNELGQYRFRTSPH